LETQSSQHDFGGQFSIATQDDHGLSRGISTIDANESQAEPDLNFQDDDELVENILPPHACK